MDIGSAFTYMFDDEEWIKKVAIGGGIIFGAIILSPIIIGLALFLPISGYMIEALKNVRDGRPIPLPEWTDLGGLFAKGLIVTIIGLVYNLPAILVACLTGIMNGVAPELDPDMANMVIIVAGCLSCFQIVLSLAASILLPAAIIRYAQYETFSSAFQFGEIFSFISSNIGDYIIVVLLSWVAGLVALFGLVLCVIGVVFTGFWTVLVTANLYGQLARKASDPMAAATSV